MSFDTPILMRDEAPLDLTDAQRVDEPAPAPTPAPETVFVDRTPPVKAFLATALMTKINTGESQIVQRIHNGIVVAATADAATGLGFADAIEQNPGYAVAKIKLTSVSRELLNATLAQIGG